jgi:hypothetical protein
MHGEPPDCVGKLPQCRWRAVSRFLPAGQRRADAFAVVCCLSTQRGAAEQAFTSSRRAICRRWTRSLVRMNSTRHPSSTSVSPMAAAKWLLPAPGGPNNKRLAPFSSQPSPAVSAITCALLTIGTVAVAQRESGFAEAGLRCFNNPSSNNLSYRIIAVVHVERAKGPFIGRREPLDVIRPGRRLLQ